MPKSHKDIEQRTYTGSIELRSETESDSEVKTQTLIGYASVFNQRSELILGEFYEMILPGAFDDVLDHDVRALFNHDPSYVLGRTRSGTLKLSVDEHGLNYAIHLPNNTTIRDLVLEPIRRGDISQSSFGFRVASGGDTWEKNGDQYIRAIHKVDRLFDVSPVTYPAYHNTDSALRSLDAFKKEQISTPNCTRRAQQKRARELHLLTLI